VLGSAVHARVEWYGMREADWPAWDSVASRRLSAGSQFIGNAEDAPDRRDAYNDFDVASALSMLARRLVKSADGPLPLVAAR
jgi:hypothetical protein